MGVLVSSYLGKGNLARNFVGVQLFIQADRYAANSAGKIVGVLVLRNFLGVPVLLAGRPTASICTLVLSPQPPTIVQSTWSGQRT